MERYLSRVSDAELERLASSSGAIVIEGARATGKTESARRLAASELRLDSADPLAVLARSQPSVALAGAVPRLLDEWQMAPGLWNEVRHAVDDRGRAGQFILTGSATPDDDPTRHSGAGRFGRVLMRTMTLSESGQSTGAVSLAGLLAGEPTPVAESELDLLSVVRRIVTGGWPGWVGSDEQDTVARVGSYLQDIAQHDFPTVAGPRRDPRRMTAYLRAIAALSAEPATFAALNRRMAEESIGPVGAAAASELHDLAERMYLVEDQPAWSPRLRSRSAAIQTPKRHLADPSLAASLLGAGSERLLADLNTLGFLFESQVVHDLRVYAQASGARGVFHYRDTKGRDEIDAVVEAGDGGWLGVEVKLGPEVVDAAAANLLRIAAKIEKAPLGLMIVIPNGVAHRRPDGVDVVPLSVLGP